VISQLGWFSCLAVAVALLLSAAFFSFTVAEPAASTGIF
jgi:hypothetical protein